MPDDSYRIGAEGGKVKITDQNIESRIEEINKELEKIRKVEKKFPQGELQCFKNEKRYKRKMDYAIFLKPKEIRRKCWH